eukprot:SAG22_NODE_1267_length_4952_cov_3.730476_2_plen_199_part_00
MLFAHFCSLAYSLARGLCSSAVPSLAGWHLSLAVSLSGCLSITLLANTSRTIGQDVGRNACKALGLACIDDPAGKAYARQADAVRRVAQLLGNRRHKKLQRQAAWTLGHLVAGQKTSAASLEAQQGQAVVELVNMLSSNSNGMKTAASFGLQALLGPTAAAAAASADEAVGELLGRQAPRGVSAARVDLERQVRLGSR